MELGNQKLSISQLKKQINNKNVELAKLDQNNRPVEMYAKTKKMNQQTKIIKAISNLTWQEKYEWVQTKKLKANQYFKNGNLQSALSTYLESLLGLQRTGQQQKVYRMKQELQYPILMNIVTCFYRKKQFQKGLQICDEVIKDSNSNFLQAFYKKAYLFYEIGQYKQAKQLLIALQLKLKTKNTNQKVTKNDISELFKKIIIKTKQQQNMYKRIFRQDLEEEVKEQQEKIDILIYNQTLIKRLWLGIKTVMTMCCKKDLRKNFKKSQHNEENQPLLISKQKNQ